ncbi:MAG: hypothetical protein ACOYUZ_05375 [Patescibacteria group bacterium]
MNPAYAYIYDDFLADRRYQDIVSSIETRLSSMGLNGKVGRLAMFRSARELVEGFVDQGAKNIIVVGNDDTLNKVMWFLPDLPVVAGYIPVAEPAEIATLLGVPIGLNACEAIGARLIESLDVGKLGDRYFLTQAVFENTTARLEVDSKYSLSLIKGGKISIRNLGGINQNGYSLANAKDGLLDIVITPHDDESLSNRFFKKLIKKKPPQTRILLDKGEIISTQPTEAQADRFSVSGFKFSVQAVPGKLRIITGRMRRLK